MELIFCEKLLGSLKKRAYNLWNKEYPINLSHDSITNFDEYLGNLDQQCHVFIQVDSQNYAGWYWEFIRDQEKWFGIILDAHYQGKGYGSILINEAKRRNSELNGWVIDHNNDLKENGLKYQSPIEFYTRNGFEVLPNDRLDTEKIQAVKIRWVKQ